MNKKLNILEWFGGIGAGTQALKGLNIPVNVVDYVELDKHATNAYNVINNERFEAKDINSVDVGLYEDIDLLIAGWPCTSLSNAGKQKGMGNVLDRIYDAEDKVKAITDWYYKANAEGVYNDFIKEYASGLVYTIITKVFEMGNNKPKRILLENVKALLSKKFEKDLNLVKEAFSELGYDWNQALLNSKNFGIPQSRERVFIVLTRNDIEVKDISKLMNIDNSKTILKDILVADAPAEIFTGGNLTHTNRTYGINNLSNYNGKLIELNIDKFNKQIPDKINKVAEIGDMEENGGDPQFKGVSFNQDKTFTGIKGLANTLVASSPEWKGKIIYTERGQIVYRKLTTLETWRLMGFSDEVHNKVKSATKVLKNGQIRPLISESQMNKQAGNSIVVDVLKAIFEEIYVETDNTFNFEDVFKFEGDE